MVPAKGFRKIEHGVNMILDKIRDSKGPLTAKGKIFDYVEIHAFGAGLIDGAMFGRQNYEKRKDSTAEDIRDVRRETHYYKAGYFLANRSKWVLGTFWALGHA